MIKAIAASLGLSTWDNRLTMLTKHAAAIACAVFTIPTGVIAIGASVGGWKVDQPAFGLVWTVFGSGSATLVARSVIRAWRGNDADSRTDGIS